MTAELARRAAACKGWRWMPGMRSLAHPYMLDGREFIAPRRRWSEGDGTPQDGRLPDLDDRATIGCLLALVREAWGCCLDIEEFYTNTGSHQFEVHCHTSIDGDPRTFRGGTLAAALVAALEVAP